MEEEDNITWEGMSKPRYMAFSSLFIFALDTLFHPLDLLKTRQQYDTSMDHRSSSLHKLAKDIYRSEGVRGLYRGYSAATIGSIPGQIVYFGGFEVGKSLAQSVLLPPVDPRSDAPSREGGHGGRIFLGNLFAGFFADLVSLLALTPSDVVSQKMMVSTFKRGSAGTSGIPLEFGKVIASIHKAEGYSGE
jgi:hypothetical protein